MSICIQEMLFKHYCHKMFYRLVSKAKEKINSTHAGHFIRTLQNTDINLHKIELKLKVLFYFGLMFWETAAEIYVVYIVNMSHR